MENDPDLAALMATIDGTAAALERDLGVIAEALPELRRQARAAPKRRERDAVRYALGGVLTMLGCERIDPIALTGLVGNPDQMLSWLAEARAAIGAVPLANLIDEVFEDEERFAWCRQWGTHIAWRHGKALYNAAVTSFVTSGRVGPKEPWRRADVTDDQTDLVRRICTLLQIEEPKFVTRGEAFDWILERGGNPNWWAAPATPHKWSI